MSDQEHLSIGTYVVILAAGLSQRLGFPKQLITCQGQSLLRRTIALALTIQPIEVLVVLPKLNCAWSKAVYQQVGGWTVRCIDNIVPERGIAHSIELAYGALQQIAMQPHTRILFLTVDQVALTALDLKQLTDGVRSHQVRVTHYDQERTQAGIPVNMPFEFLRDFSGQLHQDQGFRVLWKNHTQAWINEQGQRYEMDQVVLPHLAADIDTMEQFQLLQPKFQLQYDGLFTASEVNVD